MLLISPTVGFSQIFEGKITYSNTYKSKLSKLKDEQLNSMLGTVQEYYIKDGDYKCIFNGVFLKMQLYVSKENKSYSLTAKSDSLFWEDYSYNKDPAISYEIHKNNDTIMGIPCDMIVINSAKSKVYNYYNTKYGVDQKLFSKHNYGNWYYLISKIKSLPLKTVQETGGYVLTSTAIKIENLKLDKIIFTIPDKNKVSRAPW